MRKTVICGVCADIPEAKILPHFMIFAILILNFDGMVRRQDGYFTVSSVFPLL